MLYGIVCLGVYTWGVTTFASSTARSAERLHSIEEGRLKEQVFDKERRELYARVNMLQAQLAATEASLLYGFSKQYRKLQDSLVHLEGEGCIR